jgi:hypothetical protein
MNASGPSREAWGKMPPIRGVVRIRYDKRQKSEECTVLNTRGYTKAEEHCSHAVAKSLKLGGLGYAALPTV